MREQGRFSPTTDGEGQVLTVRLDWRSLIPIVVLVAGVWLLGKIWETVLLLVVALILAGLAGPAPLAAGAARDAARRRARR